MAAARHAQAPLRTDRGPAGIVMPAREVLDGVSWESLLTVLWLDAMASDPPPVGILEDRIAYLQQTSVTMGRCSTVAELLRQVPPLDDVRSAPTSRVVPPLRLAG